MTKHNNPWEGMAQNTERRVDASINYDLFWIVDMEGRYGFCIKNADLLNVSSDQINLKGITIKKLINNEKFYNLYLILNKKKDYEIFQCLCEDLILTAKKYDDSEKIISAVEDRLKRWHQLLKSETFLGLSVEVQMGLFSELLFLKKHLISEIGVRDAVVSWVGPDADTQDFLTNYSIIEIKSYRSTKGEIVHISSLGQLENPSKPLFLVAYGLTLSNDGLSVSEMIEIVVSMINDEHTLEIFELKLFEYGYIVGVSDKKTLTKFIVDCEKGYSVIEGFPRIKKQDIMKQIPSVKYSIDLSQCIDYQISIDNIFREE